MIGIEKQEEIIESLKSISEEDITLEDDEMVVHNFLAICLRKARTKLFLPYTEPQTKKSAYNDQKEKDSSQIFFFFSESS